MNEQELLARHLHDQAWAALAENLADIERIGTDGPDGSERDISVVRMVCKVVEGDLALARHEAGKLDGGGQ